MDVGVFVCSVSVGPPIAGRASIRTQRRTSSKHNRSSRLQARQSYQDCGILGHRHARCDDVEATTIQLPPMHASHLVYVSCARTDSWPYCDSLTILAWFVGALVLSPAAHGLTPVPCSSAPKRRCLRHSRPCLTAAAAHPSWVHSALLSAEQPARAASEALTHALAHSQSASAWTLARPLAALPDVSGQLSEQSSKWAETVSSFSSQWGTTVSELSTQARRQLDDATQQMGPQAGDIAQRVSNAAATLTDQVTQSVTAEVNAAATSATQALSTGSMSPIMANVALQVGAGVVILAIIALVTGSLRSAKGPTAPKGKEQGSETRAVTVNEVEPSGSATRAAPSASAPLASSPAQQHVKSKTPEATAVWPAHGNIAGADEATDSVKDSVYTELDAVETESDVETTSDSSANGAAKELAPAAITEAAHMAEVGSDAAPGADTVQRGTASGNESNGSGAAAPKTQPADTVAEPVQEVKSEAADSGADSSAVMADAADAEAEASNGSAATATAALKKGDTSAEAAAVDADDDADSSKPVAASKAKATDTSASGTGVQSSFGHTCIVACRAFTPITYGTMQLNKACVTHARMHVFLRACMIALPVHCGGLFAGEATVELHYVSGWEEPTVHAWVAGQEWDQYGMERNGEYLKWCAEVPKDANGHSHLVEFVITDGNGDWDKAPSGENYYISEPGSFELRDGQLSKLDSA